ncbi:hypothetical protein J6590_038792 [Homalodisca vitripennis]|nr:hypothetical protein J6590_038792 [Homalodisca vitripennis]
MHSSIRPILSHPVDIIKCTLQSKLSLCHRTKIRNPPLESDSIITPHPSLRTSLNYFHRCGVGMNSSTVRCAVAYRSSVIGLCETPQLIYVIPNLT